MKQPPGARPIFHLYATQPEHQLPQEPSGIEEGLLISRGDSKTLKAAKQRRHGRVIKLGGFMTFTFALAYLAASLVFRQDGGMEWAVLPQQSLLNLERLREYGERLGRRFPGASQMGMGGHSKSAFLPIDWDKVRQSCAPNPLVAGIEGDSSSGQRAKVVLVTGSAGFVGMHTVMQLRKRGDGVLGLDNFNDYYPVSLKRARQLHAEAGGVYTVDGDINDAELLRSLFDTCQFTHVVHMAAQAGVRYATKNPFSYVHANLGGQVALFEAAKDQVQPPAIVYASSSSVYGLNKKQPFSEDDRVDSPASLYAATKRADELIAHVYHNIYGLSMTGLRFFTVYGPWGRPDMAAYKFAVSMMKGEPIPIFQGPNRSELSRDFTYIDDIVKGVVSSVDTSAPSIKGEAEYRIFNLGNTHPHTVTELVTLLEGFLGRTAKKKYLPVPPTGDVLATYADISRAKNDLGYQPEVSLEEGLRLFSTWFRSFYGSALDVGAKMPEDWKYKPL